MSADSPSSIFLERAFESYAPKIHPQEISIASVLLDEDINICKDFDSTLIQDSWSYRSVKVARKLSFLLIDDKGNLDLKRVLEAIHLLNTQGYSLGFDRQHDDSRQEHLLKMLNLLQKSTGIQNALKRIQKPESNTLADHLIRETLSLPLNESITVSQARRAALSALLTKLRQNVGSCFATAPAIAIHEEQSVSFLTDIPALLETGRLSRTFGGIQYSVPLSPNWGVGDLLRPILLNQLGSDPLKTLSRSPGLQIAFASVSLIGEGETKNVDLYALLKKALSNLFESPFSFITADSLIKKVLQTVYEITEEDIQSFSERSVEGPLGELAASVPFKKKSKSLSCSRYFKTLETARGSFKSLTDNALLKAWEFTLASFAEAKADFAKWNLYVSLGVSQEDAYGIGRTIYDEIQNKIHHINDLLEEWQSKYDHIFAQVKYLEGRMRRAGESEMGWIRAEYEIRRREIDKILAERDETHEKGRKLANLYNILIPFYGKKIPEYFQEIYDAQMHDVTASLYDDSPAGFRLLYKHGRVNPSLWTLIHSPQEYIQYLSAFFIATEFELGHLTETEGIESDISSLITEMILTIKRPEFLESSIFRLARAYQEPYIKKSVENLDQVKRKPWAYVSGGTMGTLTSCYFGRETLPQETKRWVESESELLDFMIDTVKELPNNIKATFQENRDLPLLAFSPTHAFLLKPGWEFFKQGWESDTYTYTWVRDKWINPTLRFLDENILEPAMMQILSQNLLKYIPIDLREITRRAFPDFIRPLRSSEFREQVLKNLSYERFAKVGEFLSFFADEIDSLLFRSLPFFPSYHLKERLEKMYAEMIDTVLMEKIFLHFEKAEDAMGQRSYLTAYDLKNCAKALLIIALKKTRTDVSYHKKITEAMQKLKFAYPAPLLVGDTNWVKNVFGFVVNPGTEKMEFWRFDDSGSEGKPISVWRKYLNGSDRQDWGIYQNPKQYGF